MEYRPLGRTGVQVSKLCLGTMMFGAWGNTDHDDSVRIIHRALDAGINFVDTADVYSAGESEEIVGKALEGPPRRRRPRDQVLRPDGRGPQPARRLAALDHRRGRELAAAARNRLDRPLPGPPPRPRHRRRRDPRRAHRPRPAGQGPLHRLVLVLRRRDRRGAVGRARAATCERFRTEQPPYSLLVRGDRARRPARPPSATAWASSPTARSPAAGCPAAGRADSSPTSPARQRLAARFDMSLPENQRKLEAVEAARAGRGRRRPVADRARDRVRRQPPRGDVGDHRAAHDGAAREPAARRRRDARRRRCSTASTRSSGPASTSTPPTPATASRCSQPALRRR